MKKLALFLAHGTEEGEAIIQLDLLRRAGIEVTTFSIEDTLEIETAHGIVILAEKYLKDIVEDEYDMLFVPGGAKGVERMKSCEQLSKILIEFRAKNRYLGAVCAGPTVLGDLGILDGEIATCANGWDKDLGKAEYKAQSVIHSQKVITGQGLGASIELALKTIEILEDRETAEKVAQSICYKFEW